MWSQHRQDMGSVRVTWCSRWFRVENAENS
jgi:hypothetical protein